MHYAYPKVSIRGTSLIVAPPLVEGTSAFHIYKHDQIWTILGWDTSIGKKK